MTEAVAQMDLGPLGFIIAVMALIFALGMFSVHRDHPHHDANSIADAAYARDRSDLVWRVVDDQFELAMITLQLA